MRAMKKMLSGLRGWLPVVGVVCLPWPVSGQPGSAEAGGQPNVIVILADDLGIGDVGAYGGDIPTPHIDSLAQTGVRCTKAYVTLPICSPSRASIMTGLYPQRFGQYGNAHRGAALPDGHPPLPLTMKRAGYATGMVGRMDLGSSERTVFELGFEEVARRPKPLQPDRRKLEERPAWNRKLAGVTYLSREREYWTTLNGPELVDFVERHKREPFYLYYAPLAVHFPIEEVPEAYLRRVPGHVEGVRRYLAGTLIALDDAIGMLIGKLRREGLYEDTLIVFTSDNGGKVREGSSNGPFRGGKVTPWEGGLRVPYIVSWPARLPHGETFEGMVSTLDIYPTAAAAAGAADLPGQLDGVNLLPWLRGERDGSPNEALYFRWYDSRTIYHDAKIIRRGPWRLVTFRNPWDLYVDSPAGFRTELYNIEEDPGETKNLAPDKPGLVHELKTAFEAWAANLPPLKREVLGTGADQIPMPHGRGWAYADEQE